MTTTTRKQLTRVGLAVALLGACAAHAPAADKKCQQLGIDLKTARAQSE